MPLFTIQLEIVKLLCSTEFSKPLLRFVVLLFSWSFCYLNHHLAKYTLIPTARYVGIKKPSKWEELLKYGFKPHFIVEWGLSPEDQSGFRNVPSADKGLRPHFRLEGQRQGCSYQGCE